MASTMYRSESLAEMSFAHIHQNSAIKRQESTTTLHASPGPPHAWKGLYQRALGAVRLKEEAGGVWPMVASTSDQDLTNYITEAETRQILR